MFPRISKFSNVSQTTGTSSVASTNSTSTANQVQNRRNVNDSSNIRNLLFGGGESEPATTPQQIAITNQQQINMTSNSNVNTMMTTNQHIQLQQQQLQQNTINRIGSPNMVIERQQNQVLANMDQIENKINSKLQEIESMFGQRNDLTLSQQLLNSNKIEQSPLVKAGLYQMESNQEQILKKKQEELKGGKGSANKRQNSAAERKTQQKQVPQRQPSLVQQQRANQFLEGQKSGGMQTRSRGSLLVNSNREGSENDIQQANIKQITGLQKGVTTNKLPPRTGPIKATELSNQKPLLNQDLEDSQQLSMISMTENNSIISKQPKPTNQKSQIKSNNLMQSEEQQSKNNIEYENVIAQLDRQVQLKNTENTKLKKKIAQLEKQIESLKQENDKTSALQSAISKDGGPIENTDERRIMILKSQNGQLTKHNAYLNDVLKSQKKIMIEVDHILTDLTTMCKTLDLTKLESKIPDIQQLVVGMKKRLKSTTQIEQKEFNSRSFEQDNPYYITKENPQFASKFEDNGEGQQVAFLLNREKILTTEQKLAMLLENSIDLYQKCFQKNKVPNTNQFLRFCEDLRQSVESLLLLGIAINPDDSQEQVKVDRSKYQQLRDYVEKKLVCKVRLDKHMIVTKTSSKQCKILNQELVAHLTDVAFWNNSRKQEKTNELNRLITKIQQGELSYIVEVYLKQQQINMIKAQYTRMFQHLHGLKSWFRAKVTQTLVNEVKFNLVEKFQDLDTIIHNSEDSQAAQVKLWSVFNMHYPDMKRALKNIMSINDQEVMGGFYSKQQPRSQQFDDEDVEGDSVSIVYGGDGGYLERLGKAFEDRVTQAREIIMNWNSSTNQANYQHINQSNAGGSKQNYDLINDGNGDELGGNSQWIYDDQQFQSQVAVGGGTAPSGGGKSTNKRVKPVKGVVRHEDDWKD
eukprot:403350089